jgi:hypothetical protein
MEHSAEKEDLLMEFELRMDALEDYSPLVARATQALGKLTATALKTCKRVVVVRLDSGAVVLVPHESELHGWNEVEAAKLLLTAGFTEDEVEQALQTRDRMLAAR